MVRCCYSRCCAKENLAPCKGIWIPELKLWNLEPWALESGIQLKESGIPLTIGIQNPSCTDKDRNPVPVMWNNGVKSRIQDGLGFPCMERGYEAIT